jgi:phosphoribosyl 1,2-cyclic phosphodiesterase
MVDFRVIASGSSGNCYTISDGRSMLLLEAGIRFREIREALAFRISGLAGCLITHEHGDHAQAVKDMVKAGVDCYMSQGTADALGVSDHHRVRVIEPRVRFSVGTWQVIPFNTIHRDTKEPLGFVLMTQTAKVLLATDTMCIPPKIPGMTHIAVECNYDADLIRANMQKGLVTQQHWLSSIHGHMSLQTCKEFLLANDLSKVRQIWLLHLSDDNSEMGRFKREIQALTGKEVYVA